MPARSPFRPIDGVELRLVSEDEPRWLRKVANLALSARAGPPDLAQIPIIAHIVGAPASGGYGGLRALGVETAPAVAVAERSPLNKIAMFHAADPAKRLVAVDCDILLAEGFLDVPAEDFLYAVPAEFPFLPGKVWRTLYSALCLQPLENPMTSTVSREPIPVPYFNSGMVMMPGRWALELVEAWLHYAEVVRRHPAIPHWSAAHDFHFEQIALACALSRLRLPLRVLPVEYNAPFRLRDLRRVRALHYHAQINRDGTIRQPPSPAAAALVCDFNAALRGCGLVGADWPGR